MRDERRGGLELGDTDAVREPSDCSVRQSERELRTKGAHGNQCWFPHADMTTDQDFPMDPKSATAIFAAKGSDITAKKDQGIFKVVKRPVLGGERPMIGDKVTVHYTGKLLTGKTFDCSRSRKEPVSFNVGKGQVLKAWDIGVLTMQQGEVCTFLCKPEYAFGADGNPNKIPPNSPVVFEIELLKLEGEILTDDRGIVRRIKVKGEGLSNPNDGAHVSVHLEGSCAGRIFDCRDVNFIVGEGEDKGIPLGVDRAMEKMQKGECCILHLKPKYGFGNEGNPEYKIGPDKDIVYEVTLKDFKRATESWEMNLNEKLDLAVGVKHKGNQYFKVGRFYQAIIQYQRILNWLELECGTGMEQQEKIQSTLLTAYLNLALCFLRTKEYSQVVENCNKVIELEKSNEKALYRRGEARLLRNEFSLALTDFQQVVEVNPSNRAARTQISLCQSKIKEYHEQDKKTYANMFQKFAERDAKVGKLKRRRDESGRSSINGEVGTRRRRSSQNSSLQL